jgi:predicted transcriptional regulator
VVAALQEADHALTVAEIAEQVPCGISTVRHHLAELRQAGQLAEEVTSRRSADGRSVIWGRGPTVYSYTG